MLAHTITHHGTGETRHNVTSATYEADHRDTGWSIVDTYDMPHDLPTLPDDLPPAALEDRTVAQLREDAAAIGLTGLSSATKAELIDAITEATTD